MLDLLAQTIVQALGFGVCRGQHRSDQTALWKSFLLSQVTSRHERCCSTAVQSAEIWDQILTVSEPWGRLRFADHRNEETNRELLSWVPDFVPIDAEDAWHPEDALFAPLTAADGSRLGILSVDLPPRRSPSQLSHLQRVGGLRSLHRIGHRERHAAHARRIIRAVVRDGSPRTIHSPGSGIARSCSSGFDTLATARPEHRSLLALAFIDLDGFKVVNDRYSHEVGDLVLQTVARRLRTVVRPHDTVVRWGGDEFLVLLEQLADETAGPRSGAADR